MINGDSRNDTLEGLLMELADAIVKSIDGTLPCVVTRASADRKRVSVRPLIRMIGKDGQAVQRDVIEGIPVYQAGAGGFFMSFPVAIGDIGWLEASDRDLGIFLQSYEESDPSTRRKHSFSDAKFVPDIMTNYTIAEEDSGAAVIQNRTGSVKIAIDGDTIRFKNGDTSITINDDGVSGSSTGDFTLNGAKITSVGDVVTAAGVSLDNHFHKQGADSDGDTEADTDPPEATE